MKSFILALAAMTLASTALAMSEEATRADTNGDGVLSLEEMQIGFPDVTDETFVAIDVNGDGLLDADEVAAAEQSGLMPASGG